MPLGSAYVSAVLADSPWGFWHMQETSGTAMADSSGNSHGGTYNAAVVSTTGPFTGWTAAHFSGSGTARVAGVYSTAGPVCFEFWQQVTSDAGDHALFNYTTASGFTGGVQVMNLVHTPCGFKMGIANHGKTGFHCSSLSSYGLNEWVHCVVQFESDGYWHLYVTDVPTKTTNSTAVINEAMNAPSSPGLSIGQMADNSGQIIGDMCAVAFYDHALTSTRIRAHFDAAVPPPPPPCQYGTRPKSGTPSATEVTDAFLQSLLLFFPSFPVTQAFANTIGMHIDTAAVCSSPPATLAPFQWTDIFTIGARALTQLEIMAWWQLCECIPGSPTPVTPTPPTPVLQPGYPADTVYVVNPTNPCLDLTEVRRKLDELLRIANDDLALDHFVQRQLVPGGTARGTTHTALSGAGSIDIADAIGVQAVITDRPPGGRELEGAPNYVWDLGWLSIMDGNGFIQERRLSRDVEVWMPRLMSDAITFGYYLKDGVVADITILYALP